MRDPEPTFPGNAVTGTGFVAFLFEELESLRVLAHPSPNTDITPVCGFIRTMQKITLHQVFLDIAYFGLIEGRAVARLESSAVLHKGADDCNKAFVLQPESRRYVCGSTELE